MFKMLYTRFALRLYTRFALRLYTRFAQGFTQGSHKALPPIQGLDNLVVQIHRVKVIFERPSHMDTG